MWNKRFGHISMFGNPVTILKLNRRCIAISATPKLEWGAFLSAICCLQVMCISKLLHSWIFCRNLQAVL